MCAKLYKVLIGDYKYPRPSVAKRYKIQSYKQSQIANIYDSIAANLAAEVTNWTSIDKHDYDVTIYWVSIDQLIGSMSSLPVSNVIAEREQIAVGDIYVDTMN